MYRGRTQTDYQNKHYNINEKDEGIEDDRGRDGGTNFILRIKEQETRLTLQEHDYYYYYYYYYYYKKKKKKKNRHEVHKTASF